MLHTLRFMTTLFLGLNEKRKSEEGATAVEYGLMVAFIAIGIILAVTALRDALSALFNNVAGQL